MSDWWLKFGCFLTGYKYSLIKHSSIASEKAVIKYTSAILLVCLIWGFIGFAFTQRYLRGGFLESLAGALILAFTVIQIERQIILTVGKNKPVLVFRGLLAIAMAFIGSVILDQMIFKEDVDIQQVSNIADKVNEIAPKKSNELYSQINELDSLINIKEQERTNIIVRVRTEPTISLPTVQTLYTKDSTGKMVPSNRTVTIPSVPNPEAVLIPGIQTQIDTLRAQKLRLESNVLTIRETLETELKKHHGFLDELDVLFGILLHRWSALFYWVLLWLFFFSIEMLVLLSKLFDNKNDYEQVVLHQMNIRIEQLNAINKDQL